MTSFVPYTLHFACIQTRQLFRLEPLTMQLLCIHYCWLSSHSYIFASLHYRYPRVVLLWRPFYRCFRCIRNEWDIKNTLIGAFATFILLSYVKIQNISLGLLMPVTVYDMKGQALKQLYLNMDGTVEYFGKKTPPF